jgi:hypothetical protein
MHVTLQLVLCSDAGQDETVTEVLPLDKHHRRIEQLGLTLAEATQLRSTLQRVGGIFVSKYTLSRKSR